MYDLSFSNGANLKWSNSQIEHFSNGAILKWSTSQMQHFGVATLCHISRFQEQRNMACDVLMNDSYIIDRKAYTALSCIQKIQEIQKSRWQKMKGNKYKNKCRKARLKPPAELTGKAVSRGHHLSGPMLVTAKIHPILLSKNKSCRFEIYALVLVVKWTNSYII